MSKIHLFSPLFNINQQFDRSVLKPHWSFQPEWSTWLHFFLLFSCIAALFQLFYKITTIFP
uniref:Uncharacterized protein n=1 Tax=Octopus bimaculoides TaxID=37653 RepID=A0A0L8FL96_OCTBM